MRSIEVKVILIVILFTFFVIGLERYLLSENVKEQFIESKKSKNDLLINTISPIVSLNLSLGLEDSYKEYLKQISMQNSDLISIKLIDANSNLLYAYKKSDRRSKETIFNYSTRDIVDNLTDEKLAVIELKFSDEEYNDMLENNKDISIKIFIVTFVLLLLFLFLVKREFRHLKKLTTNVLLYDPSKNNYPQDSLDREDEVGLIHNAIISMVDKINLHKELLNKVNASLEDKVKMRTKELEEKNRELNALASIDSLTKLYNRRYFTNSSEHIMNIAKRKNTNLSVLMIDIDDFKPINDTYGHEAGDRALIKVASILKELTRQSDVICRYGGEEFVILLPETNKNESFAIAEKLRKALECSPIAIDNTNMINITASIGISEVELENELTIEDAIHRADSAMYDSKSRGKNCSSIKWKLERDV